MANAQHERLKEAAHNIKTKIESLQKTIVTKSSQIALLVLHPVVLLNFPEYPESRIVGDYTVAITTEDNYDKDFGPKKDSVAMVFYVYQPEDIVGVDIVLNLKDSFPGTNKGKIFLNDLQQPNTSEWRY